MEVWEDVCSSSCQLHIETRVPAVFHTGSSQRRGRTITAIWQCFYKTEKYGLGLHSYLRSSTPKCGRLGVRERKSVEQSKNDVRTVGTCTGRLGNDVVEVVLNGTGGSLESGRAKDAAMLRCSDDTIIDINMIDRIRVLREQWSLLLVSFLLVLSLASANSSNSISSSSETNKESSGILQVYETEVWDASLNAWKAHGANNRWTSESGNPCSSPSELPPPSGFEFVGEWKIVVQTGRDALGWEYQFRYLQPPKRRRIWLRSLEQPAQSKHKQIVAVPSTKRRRKSSIIRTAFKAVRDDWNFKGYGISLYKSFLFPESCGLALRLPLTMNFDWWDRHPELPSLSSAVSFYYPWCIAGFLSGSVHVELVKWTFLHIYLMVVRIISLVIYHVIAKGLFVIGSVLLYPLFGKFHTLPPLPLPKTVDRPKFGTEISERVGASVSYRWSLQRGYEFRVSYWHSYLPTIMVYRNLLSNSIAWKPLEESPRMAWWQKHFGSIGTSTGYPMPLPPHFSCSACLSLSGFYFQDQTVSSRSAGLLSKDDDDMGLEALEPPISLPSSKTADSSSSLSRLVSSSSHTKSSTRAKSLL
jgi:hypothetical protein